MPRARRGPYEAVKQSFCFVSKPGSSIKKKLNLGGDKFVIPARRPRGEVDLEFREMVWAGDKYLGAVSLILIF